MNEKKAAGQFKRSESGLRDVSFDEGVPAGSQKRRLHYVPLAVLLADTCAVIDAGTQCKAIRPASRVPVPATQVSSLTRTMPQSLPEVCVPTPCVDVGPWTPRVAGIAGYLPTDTVQVSFEQSMTGATTYIQGRDGYLFPSDVSSANFPQALGRVYLTPGQVGAWDRYMSGVETATSEQGVTTLFVPASVARDIYSDKLPQWTDPLMGTTLLDLIHLVLPTRVWVDVHEGLHEAREGSEASLCSAVNPHWSSYAAHVAWNQTLSCLAMMNPQLEGLPFLIPSGANSADVPNEYETPGAPARSGPQAAPTYEQDLGSVHLLQLGTRDDLTNTVTRLAEMTDVPEVSLASPVDFQNEPALTYNPNGHGTTSTVCDSQGNNLGLEVAAIFEYTAQVSYDLDTEQSTDVVALIEAYKLSIVIVELMLRYLAFAPAVGKQNRFPDYDRSDGNSRV